MKRELISIEEENKENFKANVEKEKEDKKLKKPIKSKLIFTFIVYLVLVPAVIFIGMKLFSKRSYNVISMIIAVLACVPFFVSFEKGKTKSRELVVIAVMTAISVVGRLVFQPLPGFKPVTAIVIITAIAFGVQAGFITGAMSAIVSNIFYGQGPWTPFQMFAWGFLGLLAGLIFRKKKKPCMLALILVGIFGGILFSFIMDVWSVFNVDGGWNTERYLALLVSGIPFTVIYAVSNVVFLLILTNPILTKLNRIKEKYQLFI